MSAGEILKQAVEIGFRVGPSVVEWIADLIKAGKSGVEAEAIVRRDIQSRREQYQAAKAEDMAALDAKWEQPIGERETQPPANPYPDAS